MGAVGRWRQTVAAAADVWFAQSCIGCGLPGESICDPCTRGAKPVFAEDRCVRCEGPLPDDDAEELLCELCREARWGWVAAVAPYEDLWRRWILQMKLGPEPALLPAFARELTALVAAEEPNPTWLVVGIPAGNREGIFRGPHVATGLAQAVAQRLQLPYAALLWRPKPGRPQRKRRRGQRRQLDPELFAVEALPPGVRTVLLVDDVMTTGATMSAATEAILGRYPGADVVGAVLARAGAPVAS